MMLSASLDMRASFMTVVASFSTDTVASPSIRTQRLKIENCNWKFNWVEIEITSQPRSRRRPCPWTPSRPRPSWPRRRSSSPRSPRSWSRTFALFCRCPWSGCQTGHWWRCSGGCPPRTPHSSRTEHQCRTERQDTDSKFWIRYGTIYLNAFLMTVTSFVCPCCWHCYFCCISPFCCCYC